MHSQDEKKTVDKGASRERQVRGQVESAERIESVKAGFLCMVVFLRTAVLEARDDTCRLAGGPLHQ